ITGTKQEKYLGILIKYPESDGFLNRNIKIAEYTPQNDIKIGFIGLGQFAQNYIIPPLKKQKVDLISVSNSSAASSLAASKHFGFSESSTDGFNLIENKNINTVFIASRHDSHGEYVAAALSQGKNVYVEKPLAINPVQLDNIIKAKESTNTRLM